MRVAVEHGLITAEARLNRVVKVDCALERKSRALSESEWETHAKFEALMTVCQIGST